MTWLRVCGAVLSVALAACNQGPASAPQLGDAAPSGATSSGAGNGTLPASPSSGVKLPPLSTGVRLRIVGRSNVRVGGDLGLRISVVNESQAAVTVVRPVYGSWEQARQPTYRLEWLDAAGNVMLDPLGFAPGLSCGVLDDITEQDRIRVAPGGEASLPNAPAARPQHDILPSARPGRYSLRVRYLANDLSGASPLHLLSNTLAVQIDNGDEALWACRAKQITNERDHQYIHVTPAKLVAARGGGWWLVYSRYIHTVRSGVAARAGEIWLRELNDKLVPMGEPVLLRRMEDEVGWVTGVAAGDSIFIAHSPGPVGGRSVETFVVSLKGATPTASQPARLLEPPGNPYVIRALRSGDRIVVAHAGNDASGGALMLTLFDQQGTVVGRSPKLAPSMTDFELFAEQGGPAVLWLQRGDDWTGGVAQSLQLKDGAISLGKQRRIELNPAHSLAGVADDRGALHVAYADATVQGNDPGDMMGLFSRSFAGDGRPRGAAIALSPTDRNAAHFGRAAWRGSRSAFAYFDQQPLRAGTAGRSEIVSKAASGHVHIDTHDGGYTLLWTDVRDDHSQACGKLRQCAPEGYVATLRSDGSVQHGPQRATHHAKARPLMPSSFDWQQHCPASKP